MARAAGVIIDWQDLDEVSRATPLLARVYPNGSADVNHFHAAGGMGFVIRELIEGGLLHRDIRCVHGGDLLAQSQEPYLHELRLTWRDSPKQSADLAVLRPHSEPFDSEGGLRLVQGNLGRAVVKVSAVQAQHRVIEAPAIVFEDQDDLIAAFKAGELEPERAGDFVAVIRAQGPMANGMPELHKLTPTLSVLQDRGQRVALLTDGRMSGASGKVLAAIHAVPEAAQGGPLAKLRDGDRIRIDAYAGVVEVLIDAEEWATREVKQFDLSHSQFGLGRELFGLMRSAVSSAEAGACTLFPHPKEGSPHA